MHQQSAIDLRDQFLQGNCSATDICRYFLKRIETYDDNIGAFLAVYRERAEKKAEELDQKRSANQKLGKLAAIPIAVKDNIHVKGEITTCGSKFLINFRAPFDSTAVRLLEEEDAIIIGKTNLDEFAMGSSTENSALQQTYNPWNLHCVPGGSSGGSAAAVAARFCPLALGSDTGGSVRQPASFCGVVGLKPTYGRVSRFGLVAFGSSLDQIGPFAANARDAALVMEVIGRHCSRDSTSIPSPPEDYLSTITGNIAGTTLGVPWQFLDELQGEPRRTFDSALETMKTLGIRIVDVDLSILKYSIADYYILATAEASTNLARFDGIRYGRRSPKAATLDEVYDLSKEEGFGSEVKRRILLGTFVLSTGYQEAFYKKAQKVRTLIIERYKQAFAQCDAVVMPTTPAAAFPSGTKQDPLSMYLEDIYTISANLAGLPAMSIVNGFSEDQRPYGIQLIGPQKHEEVIFRLAHGFEQATDFHRAMPPLLEGKS